MSESVLHRQIQRALNESRILILGTQVLLGIEGEAVLEPSFKTMSARSHDLIVIAFVLLVVTFALLVSPTSYHLITWGGEDHDDLNVFVRRVVEWALFPFACALGADFYIVVERFDGTRIASIFALTTIIAAVVCWYVIEVIRVEKNPADLAKHKRAHNSHRRSSGAEATALENKIDHILTESRMILPGTQALLGFQFLAMLMQGFDKLPALSKNIHLASLSLMMVSIILLMTPAAYHRIVESGEATQHFFEVASLMILASMVPLGLGMCGDFYVVAYEVSRSALFSIASSIALITCLFGLWFGFTVYQRIKINADSRRPRVADSRV